jgi:hypothetical protein
MKVRRILKWLAVLVICLLVGIQFIRPVKSNPQITESRTINAFQNVTPEVNAIFDRSCADCHSNKTSWPWYTNVAPTSWFTINHVNEGRRHLNFSDWARLNQRERNSQLNKICDEVKSGDMPLSSYTLIHRNAKLSPGDVGTICNWVAAETQASAKP